MRQGNPRTFSRLRWGFFMLDRRDLPKTMTRGNFLFILSCLLVLVALPCSAQVAEPDPSFSGDGFDTLSTQSMIGYDNMTGFTEIGMQPDGKILSAGYIGLYEYAYITRHLPNGVVDTTFGDQGTVVLPFWSPGFTIDDLALCPDGSIVLGGTRDVGQNSGFGVVKLLENGELDASFAGGYGYSSVFFSGLPATCLDVAIRSDDRIMLTGAIQDGMSEGLAAVVFASDGYLDPSFNGDGRMTYFEPGQHLIARQAGLDSTDRIVIAGDRSSTGLWPFDLFVARINTDGTLDTGFGTGGTVVLMPPAYNGLSNGALLVHADNRIVITAFGSMIRLLGDGLPDTSFGVNGCATIPAHPMGADLPRGSAVQADGAYLLSGTLFDNSPDGWQHVIVRRVLPDGTLDASFGTAASFVWPGEYDGSSGDWGAFRDVLQPDGRILLCGFVRPPWDAQSVSMVMRLKLSDGAGVPSSVIATGPSCRILPCPLIDDGVLEYTLDEACTVSLRIIDATGRTARTAFAYERRPPGVHREPLDFTGLASGIYSVLLENDDRVSITRVVKR